MIVCAALHILMEKDNLDDIIVCGLHHSDCYYTLFHLNPDLSKDARKNGRITEGFITTDNHFLDRYQAYQHAIECGQLSAQLRHDKSEKKEIALYSEDLY